MDNTLENKLAKLEEKIDRVETLINQLLGGLYTLDYKLSLLVNRKVDVKPTTNDENEIEDLIIPEKPVLVQTCTRYNCICWKHGGKCCETYKIGPDYD